jgi:glycosyltransferase involved in cell wall biosynthesis
MGALATPRVSLVIAVYQRADFLARVLTSVEGQTLRDVQVVVADDGSGPDVATVIERWQGRLAHPIVHEWHEDAGFRKTIIVNRAVRRAAADYLVFIDGDCILHHRFLECHYRRRRRRRVLAGRRVMLDATLTESLQLDDIRSRRLESVRFWWRHAGQHDRKNGFYAPWLAALRGVFRDAYSILGSNFSVHRDDFFAVNGYDERIVGRGLEDNNLWARFVNSGMRIKPLTFEAIQYHCYHATSPMPHAPEFVQEFHGTRETRTPFGIVKD